VREPWWRSIVIGAGGGIVLALFGTMNGTVTGSEPLGDRTLWLGRVAVDGEESGAAGAVISCGDRTVYGLYIGDTSTPSARAVLGSARCAP